MTDVEAARLRFKPDSVRVLFIGESAPVGGTFFYTMDSLLYDATQWSFRDAIPDLLTEQNFLRSFQGLGCYLVDLCDRPVNRLPDDERDAHRDAGVAPLGRLIAAERPAVIVNVMKSIRGWIDEALAAAGYEPARRFDLPFPRKEHTERYVEELAGVLRSLHADGLLVSP